MHHRMHWWSTKCWCARLDVHTVVLRHILCSVLTEVAEVVVELHGDVATYNTIPSILRITAAHGAHEGVVLVKHIVNTYKHLTQLVLKEFLTKVEVADKEVLVIVVGKADILVVVRRSSYAEALPEYPLKST